MAAVCLVALLALPATTRAQSRPPLDPELGASLARDGTVTICVTLADTVLADTVEAGLSRRQRSDGFRRAQERFLGEIGATAARVHHRYRYSPCLLLEIHDQDTLDRIASRRDVRSVDRDLMGSGGLNESRQLIHANEVHDRGFKGAGRVVAIIDSGVDTNHPDLEDAIVHQYHILHDRETGLPDVGPGAEDDHGHGTNVTGIIASRGTVAPRGVAPGTSIVSVKVLDFENRGYLSDWAAGVEYVVHDLHEAEVIRVDAINMSLVSDAQYEGECDPSYSAFSAACAAALEAGITLFVSSGNTGSISRMTSPACFSSVIAVGSVADSLPDRISTFTSRNEFLELLAPGAPITSTGMGGGTSTFSGTSQASPHAAAVAAILRGISPTMPPAVILTVLQKTGVELVDAPSEHTFHRLDALAAIEAAATPGDCNENGLSDFIDLRITLTSFDCNVNEAPDECDLAGGTSLDVDGNGVPDECETPLATFRRGDANASARVDLSDAVSTFVYLFAGGEIGCRDAADSDDSSNLDLTDGIYTLNFLFTGGPAPPLPGPANCGADSTLDELDCAAHATCP